ncbi:MAG: OmpH family outer membrane protein [Selenomonadaceae bacterium]|nr:OmpH family outer membrane protein [Selenomonadaceae bacterium]MBR1858273.1 OmpH family outer membrane protein [Selenomonadaceae bacterium]
MIKLEKKQVKIISIIIALVFIGSVVALALTQSGGMAAAKNGNVGTIDYRQVMMSHPDLQNVETQMQTEIETVRKEFEERAAGMTTDQEKQDYYQQSQERLRNKQQELIEPIEQSIKDAVKKTAEAKGLSVVIEQSAVVYGGQDITQDVIAKLKK